MEKVNKGCCVAFWLLSSQVPFWGLWFFSLFFEVLVWVPENPYPPNSGGEDSPSKFGGWILENHLFYSDFSRPLPKFGGWNLPPPNLGVWVFRGAEVLGFAPSSAAFGDWSASFLRSGGEKEKGLWIIQTREWPRYCRKVCWSKMVRTAIFRTGFEHLRDQNGPKWSILVHFGLKRSILVHLGPPSVLWPCLTNS